MDAKERIERVLSDIYYIADVLQFAAEILQLPNCNDCAKTKSCQYVPGWGKTVRYNCPFWQGKCDQPPEEEA